jgi:UDP:flavonoid glycosyltransferase YjiC (YdhE family)
MRVLIAATPLMGHLNPLLAIGHTLINDGCEVLGLSANIMRARFEKLGAPFRVFPGRGDVDLSDRDALFPEWKTIPPGPERLRFALERFYIDAIPAQHAGLLRVLEEFPADVILGDNFLFGVLPMLLGPRSKRPVIVLCGTMLLHCRRDDAGPHFAGLPPATSDAQREKYAAISKEHDRVIYDPVKRHLNDSLVRLGVAPLSTDLFHALVALPDAYLQLTVPSFEFPRQKLPASVHFIGTPPIIPRQAPLPPWAHELDGCCKVVLVTQGTLSNFDFSQLVAPTLEALANEPDVLVVVTTGGRPVNAIPGPVPTNARLATYLPFEWLLPKIDVLVTNGGYGSVNQALSFGVPLVTAGLTEDKADVNARVAWSGVGVDLATNYPTPEALRKAVHAVLENPNYSSRAASMAAEYGRINTRSAIIRILEEVSGIAAEPGIAGTSRAHYHQ